MGLLATVIGLTGSAIVYREALDAKLSPGLYRSTLPALQPADAGKMLTSVRRHFPGRVIRGAEPTESGVWLFFASLPGKDLKNELSVFVDPGTTQVLGQRGDTAGLINTLAYLHFELLGGATGRLINGIGAALLLFLSLSGVVLWWPGRKRWKRGLTIDTHARPARFNWDLHTAGGFYASVFLVVLSVTGVYFCLDFVRPLISLLTGGQADDLTRVLKPSQSSGDARQADASLNPLLRNSLEDCPGCTLRYVQLPVAPKDPVRLLLFAEGGERTGHYIWDDFDRHSGRRLRRLDTAEAPFGVRLMLFFGPLHFGTWAGQYSKVAWVVLGLTPGVLFITGFLMWWRRAGRKLRSRPSSQSSVHGKQRTSNSSVSQEPEIVMTRQ